MDVKKLLDEGTTKDPITGCWNYTCVVPGNHGYCVIGIDYKRYLVHRLSASLFLDFDLDSDLHICHKCDNKICWNPAHLFIGTAADNNQDAMLKGRVRNQNSDVTHCIRGHEFTKENTYVNLSRGYTKRYCVKCREAQAKVDAVRLKQERAANPKIRPDVTHCNRGHEFTKENTYEGISGGYYKRYCKKCKAAPYAKRKALTKIG